MGLLYDAALAWHGLQNVNYFLLLGRKGKWSSSLFLDFSLGDFPHLAGMQYASDVDFDVNPAELRGEKLISKIIGGEIDDTLIERSANWEGRIRGRLEGIIALEAALDSDFLIYIFDSRKVPYGTNISAKYVIKDQRTGMTFFFFVDSNENRWFCRSIFQANLTDYTVNQTRVFVLRKRKQKDGTVLIDYTNPHYRPQPGDALSPH